MRDYTRFDKYVDQLQQDIYPQPPDAGHTEWAIEALELIPVEVNTVLDVGCGEGFLEEHFQKAEIDWFGVTLGEKDFERGRGLGRKINLGDYSFLNLLDNNYDMVFARHALEHSPFPIITLMEWYRVARKYLLLVAPAPEYWNYNGQNHYSVANEDQLWWWLARAGWHINKREYLRTDDKSFLKYYMPENKKRDEVKYPGSPVIVEYRYLCEKVEPRTT